MQISTQTDDHNLRKVAAVNKKHISSQIGLKFQNLKFKISCKISFWNNQKWLSKVMCFDCLRN